MSLLPDPLPLEDTTPITEAVENSFDEVTRSIRDISHELQTAISIATRSKQAGAFEKFVVQTGRLGVALLHGYASAFSSAADGVAMIAADEAEWWWSKRLALPFAPADRHGVVRAKVKTIPHGKTFPSRSVRVARATGNIGQVDLIDRGGGVPPGWDGTCYVSVRQYDDYKPGASEIFFRMVDGRGHTIAEAPAPIYAVFSL